MCDEVIGLISLALMFCLIFVGFPIAFTLLFLGLATGMIALGPKTFYLMTLTVFQTMRDPVLSAIPFFLFMGYLLENAGLMQRLFRGIQKLLWRVNGSLYLAVGITATIFAAATGIVGSAVTLLGVMAGRTMISSKYDTKMCAGIITAGGTLGILIPPSIMLVVLGPVAGVSVVDLFAAAVIPGVLLATLFMAYCFIRCLINPKLGPALSESEKPSSMGEVVKELIVGSLPVSVLIAATLGTILFGLATPTEASAMGAAGSMLLAVIYRKITLASLKDSLYRTLEISSMILLLMIGSNFYGAVFSTLGSAQMLTDFFLGLNLPPTLMLMAIMLLVFLLGWPLEWIPIVLIVIPIVLPIVKGLGIDILWFCVLMAVTMQTCWLSPPVALSAYFLKGVVPEWDMKDIYAGMAQFMVLQVVGALLVLFFPALVSWLPEVMR